MGIAAQGTNLIRGDKVDREKNNAADLEIAEEDGAEAIATVLGEETLSEDEEEPAQPVTVPPLR